MRVVAGLAKGTALSAPKGRNTRPTADRVKESMFAVIQFEVADRRVLDLFAGSGALGIEALSRGAAYAVFVDESPQAAASIRENLAAAKFAEKARMMKCGYGAALSSLKGEQFSLVFMDPPYAAGVYEKALSALMENGLLTLDAIVVLEKDAVGNIGIPPFYEVFKQKKYGGTEVVYLRRA